MKVIIANRVGENPLLGMKRGACGIVYVTEAGLRPVGKLTDVPPDPAAYMRRTSIPTMRVERGEMAMKYRREGCSPVKLKLERAYGFHMSAGHGTTGEKASLLHSPGISDLIELDIENTR